MDELTARLRERVDAQSGRWNGTLAEILGVLGYQDIDPKVGDEIIDRLAIANLKISPDISNPGYLPFSRFRVEAMGSVPSEITAWELPVSDSNVPAGWYAYPDIPGQQRYWDGEQWIDDAHSGHGSSRRSEPFAYELSLDFPPKEFASRVVNTLSGSLAGEGYTPTIQIEGSASYVRHYSPWYFILLYIIFFPIGLLLLLARPVQTVAVAWRADDKGGTFAEVRGIDSRVRVMFDAMDGSTRTL